MRIVNGRILTPRGFVEGDLFMENGRIAQIGGQTETEGPCLDAQGGYVLPGFVDVHVHGAYGYATLMGREAIEALTARMPSQGVTSYLPTFAGTPEEHRRILQDTREAMGCPGARIAGAHLEGPFVNPERNGASTVESIRPPRLDTLIEMCGPDLRDVKMMTIAPEMEGAQAVVEYLADHGVVAAIGHTTADSATVKAAADWGATQASHLYNGMPPMNHRADTTPVGCFLDDRIHGQIICDGIHVNPAMIRLAVKFMGVGRIIGITDAMQAAGMPDGEYDFLEGDRKVTVVDGICRLPDGTLASSTLTMDQAFRNFVNVIGLTVEEASRVLSYNPARSIGLMDRGEIDVGQLADVVVLTPQLILTHTLVGGQVTWKR